MDKIIDNLVLGTGAGGTASTDKEAGPHTFAIFGKTVLGRKPNEEEVKNMMTLRSGMDGIRKMSWMALLAAALLGAGTAYADQCSDAWAEANAAGYCGDAGDTVTVEHVVFTSKCSVDIACYVEVDLLNGPGSGETLTANFYATNPIGWQVWVSSTGTYNSDTNGLPLRDVDDITICYYQGPLTGSTWISWRDKLVVGSCGSGEVHVDDAVANGLDMRVSAN